MQRLITLFAAGLFAILNSSSLPAADNDSRPNFILIIADDMAADDCGAMGHPHIQTPNLDQLASDGLVFDQAFLTCSSCSPSRSSIITCKYPHQTNAEQLHWPLPADQTTFVELLKQAGYYTASSGKWHLGPDAKRGFDVVQEISAASFQLPANATKADANVMADTDNASGCAGWVETLQQTPADKPFFLWLAAVDPHRDYLPGIIRNPHRPEDVVLPPYIPDTPEVRADFALYYDEIARLDSYVGAVRTQLIESERDSNTYIIFISDNGRPFPRCKTTVLDSGIRTPLFVRIPETASTSAVANGKRTNAMVSSIDIGTTILELAGVAADDSMMGKSFRQVLDAPTAEARDIVFSEHNWHDYDAYQRAVRSKQFKYIRNFDTDLTLSPPADAVRSPTFREMQRLRSEGKLSDNQKQCFIAPRATDELYDLTADPHELVNLADKAEYQEVLANHRGQLEQWRLNTYDAATTQRSEDEFDRETGAPLKNRKRPRQEKFDGFEPMFNDVDLTGWKRINTHLTTWTMADGILKCSGKPIGEIRTERMYQNFIMELEWRHLVPKGNAGVFVWADDITAPGVPFHRGIEVQILENDYGNTRSHTTHGDIFPIHGAQMIPINGRGGSRAFPTESRSNPAPQWNHYRIVCNDGEISLAVNGKIVTRGEQCSPRKGYICLESEGGVVEYRNVRIKELPASPVTLEQTATADRNLACLYTGIDLQGWTSDNIENWSARDWVLAYRGKDSQQESYLETEQKYGESPFVIDVKPLNEDSRFQLAIGEDQITSAQSELVESLNKVGSWSRIEISRSAETFNVDVNGKTVMKAPSQGSSAPLRISASGDVDFTNIYAKQLTSD